MSTAQFDPTGTTDSTWSIGRLCGWIGVLFVLIAGGCAHTQNLPAEDRTSRYEASYETVFDVTVEAFSAGGYPIRESDRASGIISTGYRHRNWLAAALLGQERTMISASIGEVSGGTEVTLTITVQEREGRTWQAEGMRTSQIEETYDEWFDRIRAQL